VHRPFLRVTTIGVLTNVATEQAEAGESARSVTLTVCLMTAGPGPRVAALLELLRPVATEIVVALDGRADAETQRAVASSADVVFRYRYREPNERALPWLISRCRGDWIFQIDDDEIPGAELLAALPVLVRATDVTHYWLLRRWLWPDECATIAEHPWSTDYQLRLLRNDPVLLSFPTETHRPIEVLGPHRFLRLPLYHADLLVASRERREAKARRYEALRPGKRVGGGPMNHVFHMAERRPGFHTEPVPAADVELVRRVLQGTTPASAPIAELTTVDAAEIEPLWTGRELSDADHRGRIQLLDEPSRLLECEQRTFDVLVENLGGTAWPAGETSEPEIRLSYQWLDETGTVVAFGLRTAFPADLVPGESQVVPLHVLAPSTAGRYTLRLDLVHEHVRWFQCGVDRPVEVERRLRVALVGNEQAVAQAVEQLTEELPQFEPVILSSNPWPPRFGPPRAPELRPYLLEGTARGRFRDLWLLATRTVIIDRVARKLHVAEPVRPLLRDAQGFLDELAACTHLLLVAGSPEPGTRELWLQAATVSSARRLGVEVVVQEGALARPGGPVDRLLIRSVLRHATLVPASDLGLS
jgi:hypothetical protein